MCKLTQTMLASEEQLPSSSIATTGDALPDMFMEMYCKTDIGEASKNRKRFSDDQIKSLQFMFETESRPEPRMKEQLATQLGLEPRQVAIWFQNKRARSKSKQMMHDYCVLKANYDALASDVESLKKENHLLHVQLQELKDVCEKSQKLKQDCKNTHEEDQMFKSRDKPEITIEAHRDDENSGNIKSVNEDTEELNMIEKRENTLSSSSGNWCSLETNSFLDESSCTSDWWGFWP